MDYLRKENFSQVINFSPTGRYIYITPNFKIINPTHDAPIFHYEGPIEGYDFKNQSKNFEIIQKILVNEGQPLTYIFVGKFLGDNRVKTSFIAHSENRKIWWRKYEGKTDGSTSQIIFENGKQVKLHKWLNARNKLII